jgi:hypothetical protein
MATQRTLLAALLLACGISFLASWFLAPPVSRLSRSAVHPDTGELLPVYTGMPAENK